MLCFMSCIKSVVKKVSYSKKNLDVGSFFALIIFLGNWKEREEKNWTKTKAKPEKRRTIKLERLFHFFCLLYPFSKIAIVYFARVRTSIQKLLLLKRFICFSILRRIIFFFSLKLSFKFIPRHFWKKMYICIYL